MGRGRAGQRSRGPAAHKPSNGYPGATASVVALRAMRDGATLHLLAQRGDPTESLGRHPWLKEADGSWIRLKNCDDTGHENARSEDKLAFSSNINARGFDKKGCASACHMAEDGEINGPEAKSPGRKFTAAARTIAMWRWKAMRSRTSTTAKAAPSIPLTSYEDVRAASTQGLPDGMLPKGLHFHPFGIGSALAILGLLLAFGDRAGFWKAILPLAGFAGLWLDAGGAIVGRFGEAAVRMIIGGGALMNGALAAMAALILLDCWMRAPLLSRDEDWR